VNSLGSSGDGGGEGDTATRLQRLLVWESQCKVVYCICEGPERSAVCELGVSLTQACMDLRLEHRSASTAGVINVSRANQFANTNLWKLIGALGICTKWNIECDTAHCFCSFYGTAPR